jgi:hypothetical protein
VTASPDAERPRRTVVRHLNGAGALATVMAGLLAGLGATRLLAEALAGEEGWFFLALAGAAVAALGVLLVLLPWRLTTILSPEGVSLAWALGRRSVPWAEIRRIIVGPLGSGGERDPLGVTLLLRDGEEVLYSLLGRRSAKEHPAAAPLLEAARELGIPVEDVTAPPEERAARAKAWRLARIKGWR